MYSLSVSAVWASPLSGDLGKVPGAAPDNYDHWAEQRKWTRPSEQLKSNVGKLEDMWGRRGARSWWNREKLGIIGELLSHPEETGKAVSGWKMLESVNFDGGQGWNLIVVSPK